LLAFRSLKPDFALSGAFELLDQGVSAIAPA
jgi:hypothetical protein